MKWHKIENPNELKWHHRFIMPHFILAEIGTVKSIVN